MKRAKKGINKGFTIVEVLIVLAISGFILLGAILLVNNRQYQSEFTSAINDARSQIEQTISDISSGYYPNNGSFSCSSTPAGSLNINYGVGNAQGTNNGCILLGSVIQFGVNKVGSGQFDVLTVIGKQQTQISGQTQEVSTYAQAQAQVLDPTKSSTAGSFNFSLTVDHMWYCTTNPSCSYSATNSTGAVALLDSLAAYSGGTLTSGAQQVYVVPIENNNNIPLGKTAAYAYGELNDVNHGLATYADKYIPSGSTPVKSVNICFASGTTNASGLLTIYAGSASSSGNGQLSNNLTIIDGNTTCS